MNLSSNTSRNLKFTEQGANRKVKRVTDINALGSAPIPNNQYLVTNLNQESFLSDPEAFKNNSAIPSDNSENYSNMQVNPDYRYLSQLQSGEGINALQPQYGIYPQQNLPQASNAQQQQDIPSFPTKMTMFEQPIVQDMAMQYGQKLADQGKQIMENQFEKWVPVTRLKYYFAVDNKYVINKIRLLFFPFTHKDWSLKFDQENPVQPRYDINALDLYIPTMAYITYVVLAGLMLGMQNRFSPEQLGIQASSALAYSIFEMMVYTITLYVANIPTNLKTLDLLAFSGYKFVIMVACVSSSIIFYKSGYYITLVYTCLSLGFFFAPNFKNKNFK